MMQIQNPKTAKHTSVPNNLPFRPEVFVNRKKEIDEIIKVLLSSQPMIISLVGIGGIGKTALALQVSALLIERGEFAGGIVWLNCADLLSGDNFLKKLKIVLDISEQELRQYLHSQPCLLVFDGFDECPHQQNILDFLQSLPSSSRALVTSRENIAFPRIHQIQVGPLDEQNSLVLLLALATQFGVKNLDEDALTMSEIANTLGHHPLALKLVAGLLKRLPFTSLLIQLRDALATLAEKDGRLDDAVKYRLDTLATIEQSHDRFDKNTLAEAEYHLGRLFVRQGRWYDGLRLLEESLNIRRHGDDLNALADVIYQIAFTRQLMGHPEAARIHYRDALRLYERSGNQLGIAACKAGLGRVAIQIGILDDALRQLEQAKKFYGELADIQSLGDLDAALSLAGRIQARHTTSL
jgi:tetratricopeptide (TPR) repeat protein